MKSWLLGHCWDVLEQVPVFANTSHSKFTVPAGHASDCFAFEQIDLSDVQINTLFIDVQGECSHAACRCLQIPHA